MKCIQLPLSPAPLPLAGEGFALRHRSQSIYPKSDISPPLSRKRERGWGRGWLLALLLFFIPQTHAAIESGDFANEGERQRFYQLTRELRCPKCQNQDIADSNAPIAADLRREIRRLLKEGQTNEQITAHMVSRYGEFVRYKPALNRKTWLLWFGPALLLLLGLLVLAVLIIRRKRTTALSSTLSAAEQTRLNALLKGKTDA